MTPKIAIVGGGIVGFATAYHILKLKPNWDVSLVEKEAEAAFHQTGNNSGVIHSGIYYKPGSLKALNCSRGYQMLLDFCSEHQIPYELCGKIIVATKKEELPALEKIYERGIENGLEGICYLDLKQMQEIEPNVQGIKGIRVPQTGIIDYKAVTQKLHDAFVSMGGKVYFNQKVQEINSSKTGVELVLNTGSIQADWAINCAGLYCDKIMKMEGKLNADVRIIPFRGEYYRLKEQSKHKVKHLIYPVPDPAFPFLGVHFTRRIDGIIEAGPNAVLAYQREGYKKSQIRIKELFESLFWPGFIKVALKYWKTGIGELYRSHSKKAFTQALQKLIPDIQVTDLEEGGAGVRAQACLIDGTLPDDFIIKESAQMIHVLNAPSPAATSSLSIGLTIAEKLVQKVNPSHC